MCGNRYRQCDELGQILKRSDHVRGQGRECATKCREDCVRCGVGSQTSKQPPQQTPSTQFSKFYLLDSEVERNARLGHKHVTLKHPSHRSALASAIRFNTQLIMNKCEYYKNPVPEFLTTGIETTAEELKRGHITVSNRYTLQLYLARYSYTAIM